MADLLHSRILEQARRRPDAIALRSDEGTMTFAELVESSGQVARALAGRGVGAGDLVAVRHPRRLDLLVALLGVARSGAAYLPIDAEDPPARSVATLADAGAALVVATDPDPVGIAGVEAVDVAQLRSEADEVETEPAAPGPDDLAYVIFTSGSTGKPKGVEVEHRSIAALFSAMDDHLEVGEGDVWLSVTSPAFDMSVFEFFWTLGRGITVELADTSSAGLFSTALAGDGHDITHMQATPTLLTGLLLDPATRRGLSRLRCLISSGEALPPSLAQELRSLVPGRVLNAYGPTEATIWATVEEVVDPPLEPPGVGHALAGQWVDILDADLEPVAPGELGELCIGGIGVARGYRDRPELTAERFPVDPRRPGERMYRTGDEARLLPDGRIECRGRLDRQVKIRGVRIELDEVEHALVALAAVQAGAVTCRGQGPDARLVAYVVADADVVPGAIRSALAETLPAAAVPGQVKLVDELPLTVSGKVDRARLDAGSG